jgi:hypothetical protein
LLEVHSSIDSNILTKITLIIFSSLRVKTTSGIEESSDSDGSPNSKALNAELDSQPVWDGSGKPNNSKHDILVLMKSLFQKKHIPSKTQLFGEFPHITCSMMDGKKN